MVPDWAEGKIEPRANKIESTAMSTNEENKISLWGRFPQRHIYF
jgi:hypothetical protein